MLKKWHSWKSLNWKLLKMSYFVLLRMFNYIIIIVIDHLQNRFFSWWSSILLWVVHVDVVYIYLYNQWQKLLSSEEYTIYDIINGQDSSRAEFLYIILLARDEIYNFSLVVIRASSLTCWNLYRHCPMHICIHVHMHSCGPIYCTNNLVMIYNLMFDTHFNL